MSEETSSVPKQKCGSLKAKFSPAAKQRITEYLQSFESFEPTLGLLYGDMEGGVAGSPSWSMTAFDPRTVNDTIEMYASFDAVVSYELDGFKVIIPQMARVKELDKGILDFVANRICPASASGS
jgi:hypothetical protein